MEAGGRLRALNGDAVPAPLPPVEVDGLGAGAGQKTPAGGLTHAPPERAFVVHEEAPGLGGVAPRLRGRLLRRGQQPAGGATRRADEEEEPALRVGGVGPKRQGLDGPPALHGPHAVHPALRGALPQVPPEGHDEAVGEAHRADDPPRPLPLPRWRAGQHSARGPAPSGARAGPALDPGLLQRANAAEGGRAVPRVHALRVPGLENQPRRPLGLRPEGEQQAPGPAGRERADLARVRLPLGPCLLCPQARGAPPGERPPQRPRPCGRTSPPGAASP